ncbi:MAG: 50S ribosomal protein L27 [Candidatus Levybacteria bacterium CG10_big_fil_rev_8_21_14_0_10_36_7]|nr:MAG: 50S ribosomal protein L27 [Candidatus Levybacteria bacterium CG10_big_fil_rev_8_21_14_0_10_36_7]
MAHTKAQGAVKGNRDSISKRLGVKLYAGEKAKPGNILIRQRGTKMRPGNGTQMGRDFTIFAVSEGEVAFKTLRGKKYIHIVNTKTV